MDTDIADEQAAIDPTLNFFAGTVAGVAAVAVGFPFDTVKVRFQAAATNRSYRSTFHALLTILREERLSGLYRGVFAPIIGAAPLNGLIFSSYGLLTKFQLENERSVPTLTQLALAGAGTGVICSLITSPAELIKTQQQLIQAAASKRATSADSGSLSAYAVTRRIFKQHGIQGLYRGTTSTALRDIGYGTYFWAYEATVRYWPRTSSERASNTTPWLATLTAGGLAGIAGWIATFPFDVVKTRVQSTFSREPANPYRNTWSTIVASYRAEGLPVFFRGLAPTLIRAIPVNMVTFTTFETIVHAFS
ncbi:mitochondrial carrier [Rhodofomes roseus]|uniref:Mitochondrial carrier n=1 Tax=Rhodofomes roseus TaxID=34475 RepID=A0ABQ8K5X5_9APHY|nr:mitochondrial carrier [Rhodofomes roseus]KAH9832461.1 mitochondrial carrier [Rhodofomes roseus]